MSNADRLRERLTSFFANEMSLQIPSVDTDLFDTGVLDSLAFEHLLLHLEREFGVTTSVDDLEMDHFRSISQIAGFVAAHVDSSTACL
jgi:acyl carrier protein